MTHSLEKEGIDVHYTDDIDYIPKDVASTLVVYTPAIPHDLKELVCAGTRLHIDQALPHTGRNHERTGLPGRRGRTENDDQHPIAHILTESGKGCSAFLGGISKNYGTNLLISHTPTVVAEADE